MPGLKKEHRGLRRRPLFTPFFLAGIAGALLVIAAAWVLWNAGSVTVVLTRHAEAAEGQDPDLTAEGLERAARLAMILERSGLDAIYTSQLTRTRATAAPVAAATGLTPTVIPADDIGGLVRKLRSGHRGDLVLVVGHSNTLPRIAGELGGDIGPIAEDDHGNLFILKTSRLSRGQLTRLRY